MAVGAQVLASHFFVAETKLLLPVPWHNKTKTREAKGFLN
jgi:hypothetical protein